MKIKQIIILILLGFFWNLNAQEPSKPMKPYKIKKNSEGSKIENMVSVFEQMVLKAKIVGSSKTKACDVSSFVKTLGPKLFYERFSFQDYYTYVHLEAIFKPRFKFDKESFSSKGDRAVNAFGNSNNLEEFVRLVTGKDIGDLSKSKSESISSYYQLLKFLTEPGLDFYEDSLKHDNCSITTSTNIRLKKLDYPNAIWEIKTKVKVNCLCNKTKSATGIKNASFEYITTTKGLFTKSNLTFSTPIQPELLVRSLDCCKDKKEEENNTVIPDNKKKNILTPPTVEKEKKVSYIAPEKEHNDKGGYFQVGVHAGIPIGDSSDSYGLNIGADAAYLFTINEKLNAGFGVGYSHYTGKDFSSGSVTFEGEGTGFILGFGVANYSLSDDFSLFADFGYAKSLDTDVGGVYFGAGAIWNPIPNLSVGPRFSRISVDGFGFGSFGVLLRRDF